MVPAFGMVILPQNPSTRNVQVPGWSCILSVANPALDRPFIPHFAPYSPVFCQFIRGVSAHDTRFTIFTRNEARVD